MLTAFRRLILTIALIGSVCFQLALAQNPLIFHDAFMENDQSEATETSGRAFKGPFQIGSSVTLAVLNDSLEQTGSQFSGLVNTANGQYRIPAVIPDAPIEMIIRGFFFNELTNAVSASQMELRAITRANSTVNINLLTALESERVRALVSNGLGFEQAKSQALAELMAIFGFSANATDSTQIDLDSEDGQALLAITAIMVTKPDGSSRTVNELQGLITQMTDDVADGVLAPQFRTLIVESGSAVSAETFRNNLATYLSGIGSPVTVPAFSEAIDTALSSSANRVVVTSDSGGSVSDSGTNWVMDGESITLTIAPNTGFSLDSVVSDCAGSLNPERTIFSVDNISSDCSITVNFSINQYTVTFDSAGGTVVSAVTQDFGTEITTPTPPIRIGFTFLGWDQALPETMPANNLTLTAQWTESTATQLIVTTQPAGGVSGSALTQQPTIRLLDADGNTPGEGATVTATVKSGSGELLGTTSVQSNTGIASFTDLQIDIAGSYVLTFGISDSDISTDSTTFDVGAGSASKLVFYRQASGAKSGEVFATQPIIRVTDAAGNHIPDSTATIAVSTSVATLIGTSTISASGGDAVFTGLGLSGLVGQYQLLASSDGLTQASQTINLGAGDAAQLSIVTEADDAADGVVFATQPVIAIQDLSGNQVITEDGTVTISISASGATISRGQSAQATEGLASFSETAISASEGSYTITYSYESLTPATQQITVGKAVSGTLSTDETWSGTVVLSGSFRIPSDRTLTISSGTEILIDNFDASNIQILVEGILDADASAGDPITFKARFPTNNRNDWVGIRFRNTQKTSADGSGLISGSDLKNIVVENADTGIYVYNQGAAISGSTFRNNRRGIELRKTDGVYIADSKFINNNHGIWTEYQVYNEADTHGDVINTWILNNEFVSNQTAAEININQRSTDNLNVIDNWFEDNYSGFRWGGGGYGIREANPMKINSNAFWGNGDAFFMQAYSSGDFDIQIKNNAFGDNTNAMVLSHGFDTLNISENFYYGNDRTFSVTANWLYATFDNNLIHQDGDFLMISDRGSSSTRNLNLTNNVVDSVSGYVFSLDGRINSLTFTNNVVTNSASSSYWFRNVSTTSIAPASNFIDWDGNAPASKIYDMNDDFEFGEISFLTPLASASDSTTTRSTSEIGTLIGLFSRGMPVEDRKGPRQ